MAATLVAGKYEEMTAPTVLDLLSTCADYCQKKDLLRFEYQLLKVLDFNVSVPTIYRFLERFHTITEDKGDFSDKPQKVLMLAVYIAHLSLC